MELAPPSPAVFLLLAVFSLALAVLVWTKARPGAVRKYFSLFALAVTLWLASGFLLYSGLDTARAALWARLAFVPGALLILSLYHVFMLFPDQEAAPFGRTVNAIGVAFALLGLFTPLLARAVRVKGTFDIEVEYGPLFPAFTAYALLVFAVGLLGLSRRLRAASGLRRLQFQYLLLGTVLPVIGVCITNLILPLVFKVTTAAPYGRLLSLIFLPVTAHAIIRHRLMDIRLFVQKAVIYASAIGAAAAAFGSLLWIVGFLTPGTKPGSLMESLVLAIIIAAAFPPVKNWLEEAFDRYVYRERPVYSKVLKESSQQLSAMLDAPSLAEYVAGLVARMFKAEFVEVYGRDPTRDAFVALARRGEGQRRPEDAAMARGCPLALYLEREDPVLSRDDSPPGGDGGAAAQLRELGGEMAVGFRQLGALRGVLIVGAKLSGDPYFAEDVDFLATLGAQAGVALANLELHRQMGEERLRAERLGMIGTLASGVAHEIKNPLVAIRTFADLLPERFQDEDFRTEFSKIVVKEIQRIDVLVARLRELATRPTQQLTPVDLRQPVDETVALLRGELEKKQVRVRVECGEDVGPVLGEFNLLKQLFLNLFMNAIDAMEPNGELHIRLLRRETAAGSVQVVEVIDSGVGIPDGDVTRIFEPFFSNKPGGSGLGLAICRSIADAHHARILARNNVRGRGATFTVEFPVAASSRGQGPPESEGPGRAVPWEVAPRGGSGAGEGL